LVGAVAHAVPSTMARTAGRRLNLIMLLQTDHQQGHDGAALGSG